jgi:hypothetical protein
VTPDTRAVLREAGIFALAGAACGLSVGGLLTCLMLAANLLGAGFALRHAGYALGVCALAGTWLGLDVLIDELRARVQRWRSE